MINKFISGTPSVNTKSEEVIELIENIKKSIEYPTADQIAATAFRAIRPIVMQKIEQAFDEYVRAHGVRDMNQRTEEWLRFEKILMKYL